MSTSPNLRRDPSGVTAIFLTQNFIFSGNAKYGSPSMIITIPMTQRKNFMLFEPVRRLIDTENREYSLLD
jgi:hypothetical protein